MYFEVTPTDSGFSLQTGGKWHADVCAMRFPGAVWKSFKGKESLVSELAYVTTLATPLILKHDRVHYNTPRPEYLETYNRCFEKSIPNLTEPIPDETAHAILQRFREVSLHFNGESLHNSFDFPNTRGEKRVILPFSFGKDSLLTLALLRSMDYTVIPVIIDERVLPRGFAMKTLLCRRLAKNTGIQCQQVINEIQLLSDYQVLEQNPTRLYQVQVYFIYLLAMLPFCAYYKAPLIAVNNEYANTLKTIHKNNILAEKRVMQGKEVTRMLSTIIKKIGGGRVRLTNLIGGLGDFAIHRLLHEIYHEFSFYRISCHMEMTGHTRWCHECDRCARAYLFSVAMGYNTREMEFEHSMLEEEHARYFSFFQEPSPGNRYREWTSMEEALAFHMAALRGATHPLVAKAVSILGKKNIDFNKYYKKVFSIQSSPAPTPHNVKIQMRINKNLGRLYNPLSG